jgi:hypothetical protein
MVVAGNLSFNLVDSDEFKDYVKFLRPDAEPPNCQKLRTQLDKRYDEAESLLLPGLGERTNVSLALDAWSSTNGYKFLGITCHYLSEDWKLMEVLLSFEEIQGSHTGWNLVQIIEKLLQRHNLMHRLLAVTADNASNNSTMRRSLEQALESRSINWNAEAMTVNCLAHVLNLSAKALLARLGTQVYDGSTPDEEDDDMYDGPADPKDDDDDDEGHEASSVEAEQVGDTVLEVRHG